MTINKKVLSRAYLPHQHKIYKLFLTLHDRPPYRVYHIMKILQALHIKCLYDHIYLEDLYVVKQYRKYDVINIFCGS